MKKFAQDAAIHMMGMSVMLEGPMARGVCVCGYVVVDVALCVCV